MIKKPVLILALFIVIFSVFPVMAAEEGNVLENPSFEEGDSANAGAWIHEAYNKDAGAAEFKLEDGNAHSGGKFATVINNVENDSRYLQAIKVKPDTSYKLSCYIRTEGVGQEGKGANLSIGSHLETSREIRGTNGKWEYVEMYAKVGDGIETINVTVGVGGYGALSKGRASFDDVRVEVVDNIPDGAIVSVIGNTENAEGAQAEGGNTKAGGEMNDTFWVLVIAVVFIIGLVFYLAFGHTLRPAGQAVAGGEPEEYEEEYLDEEIEADEENEGGDGGGQEADKPETRNPGVEN